MRRYSIHIIGSRGRFFSAGEPIPDDVSIPGCAEKHRIVDEQRDESDPSSTTVDDDETTERTTRERQE